jgi:hypothetical protein
MKNHEKATITTKNTKKNIVSVSMTPSDAQSVAAWVYGRNNRTLAHVMAFDADLPDNTGCITLYHPDTFKNVSISLVGEGDITLGELAAYIRSRDLKKREEKESAGK